jgi:hypothetical protein
MMVIPAADATIIIVSIEYPADGLKWVRLYDNHALGWIVDETMPVPMKPAPPVSPQPYPLIVGSFPTPAPDTSPIISPQWCKCVGPNILVPDLWRGTILEFFAWLATNNGARRPIGANFVLHSTLLNNYAAWAQSNPDLAFSGPPPE